VGVAVVLLLLSGIEGVGAWDMTPTGAGVRIGEVVLVSVVLFPPTGVEGVGI
jgi:hypothetical protein